jgi:hypothetical protein
VIGINCAPTCRQVGINREPAAEKQTRSGLSSQGQTGERGAEKETSRASAFADDQTQCAADRSGTGTDRVHRLVERKSWGWERVLCDLISADGAGRDDRLALVPAAGRKNRSGRTRSTATTGTDCQVSSHPIPSLFIVVNAKPDAGPRIGRRIGSS